MKLEAAAPAEDSSSTMDSKKPGTDPHSGSPKHEVNGKNGVKNGNGNETTSKDKMAQNGENISCDSPSRNSCTNQDSDSSPGETNPNSPRQKDIDANVDIDSNEPTSSPGRVTRSDSIQKSDGGTKSDGVNSPRKTSCSSKDSDGETTELKADCGSPHRATRSTSKLDLDSEDKVEDGASPTQANPSEEVTESEDKVEGGASPTQANPSEEVTESEDKVEEVASPRRSTRSVKQDSDAEVSGDKSESVACLQTDKDPASKQSDGEFGADKAKGDDDSPDTECKDDKDKSDCETIANKEECISPRRSTRVASLKQDSNLTKEKPEGKDVETDSDLEKVKSGGLVLKLDSGETFSVQLADEEEEEEAKSHCDRSKTPVSDEDVCVVRVETKPKSKAEIRVTFGGPTPSTTLPSIQGGKVNIQQSPSGQVYTTYGSAVPALSNMLNSKASAPVATPMIHSGGNIFVPVQYPPTSILKSTHVTVPVLLNTQIRTPNSLGQFTTAKPSAASTNILRPVTTIQPQVPTIDPAAAAMFARAQAEHEKKVKEYKKLSEFLTSMRNKVTVKNTVDALRKHVKLVPVAKNLESGKDADTDVKMDTESKAVNEKSEDQDDNTEDASEGGEPSSKDDVVKKSTCDKSKEPSSKVDEPMEEDDEKTETESTDVEMETVDKSTDVGETKDEVPSENQKLESDDVEMKSVDEKPKEIKDNEKEREVVPDDDRKDEEETEMVSEKKTEKKNDEIAKVDGEKDDSESEVAESEKSKEDTAGKDGDEVEKDKAEAEDGNKVEEKDKAEDGDKVEEKDKAKVEDGDKIEEKDKAKVEDGDEVEEKDKAKAEDGDKVEVKDKPKVEDGDQVEEKDKPKVEDGDKVEEKDKPKVEEAAPEQTGDKGNHEEAAKKLRPVARFLYYSGLDLAREYIYKDLLDKQEVLLDKKKLTFEEEVDFYRLKRMYRSYKSKNRPMHPRVKKCRSCDYQTESSNVMHLHHENGHVDSTVGRYECALCDFEGRSASAFKYHMEAEHNMNGRHTTKPAFWHCDLCPYEHNNKAMLLKHKMKCSKKFDLKKHLFPTYDDINFLFRALPGPSIGPNPAQNPPALPRPKVATIGPRPSFINQNPVYTTVSSSYNTLPTAYNTISSASVGQTQPQIVTYMTANGPVRVQLNPPKQVTTLPQLTSKPTLVQHLSTPATTSLSTLGKRPAPSTNTSTPPPKVAKSELEICEICGGFIKDRTSLRMHFKMAHCIEIDEAVITTKQTAPLSCDVCLKRFWTFQGLTMHRVAMNHIPQSNTKSLRGNKCFICGVFVADIMKHINSVHNMIPGQLNTIRVCPVCGHTMNPGNLVSHLKLLHNMVLPSPVMNAAKPPVSAPATDGNKVFSCPSCKRSFISIQTLNNHIDLAHSYKCHLCDFRCTSIEIYKSHILRGHKKTSKQCTICKKNYIGTAYTVHILKEHCRKFCVKLERCDHLVEIFKSPANKKDVKSETPDVKSEVPDVNSEIPDVKS